MNARFWLPIGATYVKLTLKPGQSFIRHDPHPERSGWKEARDVYRNLGNGFIYHGWSRVTDHNISGGFHTLRVDMRKPSACLHPVL